MTEIILPKNQCTIPNVKKYISSTKHTNNFLAFERFVKVPKLIYIYKRKCLNHIILSLRLELKESIKKKTKKTAFVGIMKKSHL
jgi:hypothetical protein